MYNNYMTPYRPQYNDELKMVNGMQSAELYNMMPNSRVLLMDSNMDRFYIKETDASGMASIRVYDFKEVKETPKSDYITIEQLREVLKDYEFTPKQKVDKSAISDF